MFDCRRLVSLLLDVFYILIGGCSVVSSERSAQRSKAAEEYFYDSMVSSSVFCFFLLAVLPRFAEGDISESRLRFIPEDTGEDDVSP